MQIMGFTARPHTTSVISRTGNRKFIWSGLITCTHEKFLDYTPTEFTNTMSTVYTILDYEYRLFHDVTTLSNTMLEHAQSHPHALNEWVWSINHRHAEQKMHDL